MSAVIVVFAAWRSFASPAQRDSLYSAGNPTETRQRLFGDIAPVYDELNDRLSFGQHKVWKQMTVNWASVKRGNKCLDLCCGSGDLTFLLAKAAGSTGQVVGLDFAAEMLQYAGRREEGLDQRQRQRQSYAQIRWEEADATDLPFQDQSFDAVTMGYGLRNVASIPAALREVHRVLKPNSKAAILDFNNASKNNPIADFVQGWALENVVVPAASSYGLEEEYRYLRPSIQSFPTAAHRLDNKADVIHGFADHYSEMVSPLKICLMLDTTPSYCNDHVRAILPGGLDPQG